MKAIPDGWELCPDSFCLHTRKRVKGRCEHEECHEIRPIREEEKGE